MHYHNIIGNSGILGDLANKMKAEDAVADAVKNMEAESEKSDVDSDPEYKEGIFTYPQLGLL